MKAPALMLALLWAMAGVGQDQQPQHRPGWPCVGRPDPTYFRLAEASGGQVFLFDPSEAGDSAVLMIAGMRHTQTIARVAGALTEGVHTFPIPVDSTVESALFSVSLQCLQLVEIAPPSGVPIREGDPGVDFHQFEAGRVVTVAQPVPGPWTVTVSGTGMFFLVVQARSSLALGHVAFVERASGASRDGNNLPVKGPPTLGVPQWLDVWLSGDAQGPSFSLISAAGEPIQALTLRPRGAEGHEFLGQVTPRARQFRVAVTGIDLRGLPFQRVHAPLYSTAGSE